MKIKSKLLVSMLVLIATFGVALFAFTPNAYAATFEVDSTLDTSDSNPGNSSCNDGSGNCTLRAAIEETNALAGADTIEFNIPGSGVRTITPGAELEVEGEVTINAETQPGAACNTLVPASLPGSNQPHNLLIQIDPSGITSGMIIRDNGDNSTVRGLVIGGAVDGFTLDHAMDVTLECNYIGVNAAGTALNANSGTSILNDDNSANTIIQNNLIAGSAGNAGISAYTNTTIQNNLIGTDATGTAILGNEVSGIETDAGPLIFHNVITGSGSSGISGTSATDIVIVGNYIGVGIDGSVLGNDGDGVLLSSSNGYQVGGVDADERNVISGNTGDGVKIYNDCNGSSSVVGGSIVNNYIGTDVSGSVATGYGNGESGIEVQEVQGLCASVYRHQIGGVETGRANIIAGNNDQGVLIHQGPNNDVFSISVLQNSIYRNGTFGIDLAANSGDEPDQDLGPNSQNNFPVTYPTSRANNYLNRPVINAAVPGEDAVTVNYDFAAPTVTENTPFLLADDVVGYRLEFYVNDTDTDGGFVGNAQGQTFLGSFIVDGSENGASHTFSTSQDLEGKYVTATATILWQDLGADPDDSCSYGERFGTGPPYGETNGCST